MYLQGIAAIDFTYTTWLLVTLQKHYEAWKDFRKDDCDIKIILPHHKRRIHQRKKFN